MAVWRKRVQVRVESLKIAGPFKRFGSLEIGPIADSVDLVTMLGPNGSGKSSVFDAFLQAARQRGRAQRQNIPSVYFNADNNGMGVPEIVLHPTFDAAADPNFGRRVHVRTAHRNTPDVLANSITRVPELGSTSQFDLMIDTDVALREHYQRIVSRFVPIVSNLEGRAAEDLQKIRDWLAPVQESLARVMPHLEFTGLGDATSEGSFHFRRNGVWNFRFENLSGGEKAVFDLLLDAHIAATDLVSPIVCLDEPEVHLNPSVQAGVLSEILELQSADSQLWIATHSVGMIRRAFEIARVQPDRVAFLDFSQVSGPTPDVVLRPLLPSRQLLRGALEVALDDLAGLIAPEIVVVCEGRPGSGHNAAWDQRCYRGIFRHMFQRVDFVSCGGKGELEKAATIASVIAPGTRVLRLRDRDELPVDDRSRLLAEDENLRILERYSLESYLVDDEVLVRLVATRGAKVEDSLSQLKHARDSSLETNGSAKAALGAVYQIAKSVLLDAQNLGENKHQFGSGVLAPLFSPEMAVVNELDRVLCLGPADQVT